MARERSDEPLEFFAAARRRFKFNYAAPRGSPLTSALAGEMWINTCGSVAFFSGINYFVFSVCVIGENVPFFSLFVKI